MFDRLLESVRTKLPTTFQYASDWDWPLALSTEHPVSIRIPANCMESYLGGFGVQYEIACIAVLVVRYAWKASPELQVQLMASIGSSGSIAE